MPTPDAEQIAQQPEFRQIRARCPLHTEPQIIEMVAEIVTLRRGGMTQNEIRRHTDPLIPDEALSCTHEVMAFVYRQ